MHDTDIPIVRVERYDGLRILAYGSALTYSPDLHNEERAHKQLARLSASLTLTKLYWQRVANARHPKDIKRIVVLRESRKKSPSLIERASRADGVMLYGRQLGVAIATRDCPILVLYTKDVIIVLHCSREAIHGTTNSVVHRAVRSFTRAGGAIDELQGYIYFAIAAEHFTNERYPELIKDFSSLGRYVVPDRDQVTIDLTEAILVQLESCGISRTRIIPDQLDTVSNPRLASYRAEHDPRYEHFKQAKHARGAFNVVIAARE